MPRLWIAAGACRVIAILPMPAQAQRWSDPNFVAAANVTVHRGPVFGQGMTDRHGDRDHRRHDRHRDGFFGGWGYYDPDLNRSWASDSYNDWWHDRPDRAYPRWVRHNDGCDEGRMWQGGGVWRCSW